MSEDETNKSGGCEKMEEKYCKDKYGCDDIDNISTELQIGDLVVISPELEYLPECIYEGGIVSEIVKIEGDIIIIEDNDGFYRRIWRIK
jgi:hypothetical protein